MSWRSNLALVRYLVIFQKSPNVCHGTYISVSLDSKGHGVTRACESFNRLQLCEPVLLYFSLSCSSSLDASNLYTEVEHYCYYYYYYYFFLLWRCDPTRVMASSFLRFLDHTQRRTTVGRTPPDEWSARRRELYLTTHNTHNRQISMPPVGFEPTISAGERPQNYALDRAATGTGTSVNIN